MPTNLDYKDKAWMLRDLHDAEVATLEERIKELVEALDNLVMNIDANIGAFCLDVMHSGYSINQAKEANFGQDIAKAKEVLKENKD